MIVKGCKCKDRDLIWFKDIRTIEEYVIAKLLEQVDERRSPDLRFYGCYLSEIGTETLLQDYSDFYDLLYLINTVPAVVLINRYEVTIGPFIKQWYTISRGIKK